MPGDWLAKQGLKTTMTDETLVNIEVDGHALKAKPGSMLIEVTDAYGITVPRFCYHKKLSLSSNCRMCLVEVEKAPKPMPACTTPVAEGMKVMTKSPMALAAQKGTMEFLLINHPLDCPICDQGGECELQDLALGFGADYSRYVEAKRVVQDPDLGSLVATEMTRCIHCTRCVRFAAEIAGVRELGATGRGEHMAIGTWVQHSLESELSGNIIDLCPVGALTSKPFRFQARAWEMTQHAGIAPHDALGSNVSIHVRRNQVMRVVPREHEAINECWISDRDRFSYEALKSPSRLLQPMRKEDGNWQIISWEEGLTQAASLLKNAGTGLNLLASPNSTLEELYLLQKLGRGLGSNRIDSRLRQVDFRNDGEANLRWLGMPIADLEHLDLVLIIGGNPRKDQPLLGHRLRKAAMAGAKVHYLNPCAFNLNYRAQQHIQAPGAMVSWLAGLAKALGVTGDAAKLAIDTDAAKSLADAFSAVLASGKKAAIFLGPLAETHPDYGVLETLGAAIADKTKACFGHLQQGGNALGAELAGAQVNRLPGGRPNTAAGANASQMQSTPAKVSLLLGLDPALDLGHAPAAKANLGRIIALSAFTTPGLLEQAELLLPIGWFAETSGTLVNAQGDWQSFAGAISPAGEARPAWKVLRVLGNHCDLQGFDYASSQEVLDELYELCDGVQPDNRVTKGTLNQEFKPNGLCRVGPLPIYATDMALRLAPALQATPEAEQALVLRLHPDTAKAQGLNEGDEVRARMGQGSLELVLALVLDSALAVNTAFIASGLTGSEQLGPVFGDISLGRV
jgi:NADH-quinone oxidoreductase subunit G